MAVSSGSPITWSDVVTKAIQTVTNFANTCDNVGQAGTNPTAYSTSRVTTLDYYVLRKNTSTAQGTGPSTVTVWSDYDDGGGSTVGGELRYTLVTATVPAGLLTSVPVSTVESEFTTYIQRYTNYTEGPVTQTRLSALILQALMFVANKFVAYTAGSKKTYYKSNAYVGSAYVGTSVGFFTSKSYNDDSATLASVENAIKTLTQSSQMVMLYGASMSATSSTSSCSSSSSTSSSCSSSSCSSSSSSSCSSTSCCSSSCSCYFIAFYDIGVM